MPQRRTAIKDLRKSRTKQMHNLDIKTGLKKTVKNFLAAATEKKPETKDLLKELYKRFDKAAKDNVLHKKTAARRKSRYAKLLTATAPVTAEKVTKTAKTSKTTKATKTAK